MKFYHQFHAHTGPLPCVICGRPAYSMWSNRPYPKLMGEKRWEIVACDCRCAEAGYHQK